MKHVPFVIEKEKEIKVRNISLHFEVPYWYYWKADDYHLSGLCLEHRTNKCLEH